jgi:hypothetical protein
MTGHPSRKSSAVVCRQRISLSVSQDISRP